jgi:dihydroflavonol-4-reductase
VDGTRNVLAAAKLAGVKRFVFTSSLAAMGPLSSGQLLDESCTFNWDPRRFPYAHSKYLAEVEVLKAVEDGLPAVILNQSVSLGARDVNMISGSLVVEAARGLAKIVFPGGTNYVAIEDVVFGHIAAAKHGRVGDRYILGGTNISHAQAIEVVCDVVGRPAPRIKLRKWMLPTAALAIGVARSFLGNRIPFDENQVRLLAEDLYANSEKAITELCMPITPFRTAVENTFDWYNKNGYLTGSG